MMVGIRWGEEISVQGGLGVCSSPDCKQESSRSRRAFPVFSDLDTLEQNISGLKLAALLCSCRFLSQGELWRVTVEINVLVTLAARIRGLVALEPERAAADSGIRSRFSEPFKQGVSLGTSIPEKPRWQKSGISGKGPDLCQLET